MTDLFQIEPQPKKVDAFDRFKRTYPKRDGANPWQPAKLKFDRLVKGGVDPEMTQTPPRVGSKSMPVIPPPGSSGSKRGINPK